ncbi:ribonuclease R [Paraurantiacibacter namhicola]|uniref:Ribonuclease R n=1 Tax=Paraurantiacibacter namhicola TaxID=645517 RepID=A0A1C7D922_9SPHN|nr:ribonuclease R [Paraurantiacibacter namhicola]ANU07979.1 Ribonuclease R [Paraurantiacibacter namhicola]
MRKKNNGLPTSAQVLEFIQTSPTPAGKREIAKAFGLKGQEKIALKKLLKDMAEEGLIDGSKSAFHKMGGVPKVTVLTVVDIEDGEAIAIPENWSPDDAVPPPRIRLIEKKKHAALRKGDRVLARTEENERGWRAHPMKKLPQRHDALMGVVEIDGAGRAWLAPTDKKIRNSFQIGDIGGAEEGQLVIAESTGKGPRSKVKVTEVLGDPLAPKSFSLIAIHKYGIPHVFPDSVIAEAEVAAKLPLSEEKREDLRHVPILAIDPADARDHDDAIWAQPDGEGGFDAMIAIADVSFYVRPGGEVDREARKRGNSVYFPDRVVPMLPEVLSTDVCSLKSGEDRAAMVCKVKINAKGVMTSWRFTRAIVRIDEVIAYEDAQARVDGDGEETNLRGLWACWEALAKARADRDPLDLDLPERRVMLDDEGKITEIAVKERLDAHRVVEDFMITANVAAAKALESKTSPVVYRVHETPSREKLLAMRDYFDSIGKKFALGQVITPGLFNRMIKDIGDPAEKALVMEAVLRSQTQAYYGPANAGHFGLALGSYAHFTSPIRRYADLLVHRALVDAFGLEQPKPKGKIPPASGLSDKDRTDLGTITDAISKTERRAMEAERDTVDRYVAAWLSGRVGQTFETRITGVQSFGFFATIVGLGGDGLVPVSTLGSDYFRYDEAARALEGERTGQRYATGDTLELKLAEANPITGALKFEVPDGDGKPIERRGEKPRPRGRQQGSGDRRGKRGPNSGPSKGPGGGKGAKKGKGAPRQSHDQNARGRPKNIRHQGRGKKK